MKRLIFRGSAVLAVLALWVAGALVMVGGIGSSASDPTPQPSQPEQTDSAEPSPSVEEQPEEPAGGPDIDLGIQLSAHHRSESDYADRVMDRLSRAGAGWVRVDVGWSTLQPTRSDTFEQWYVDLIDEVLASAREHDLKVILMFWRTPSWGSPEGHPYTPPDDVTAYAEAVGRAAQRWQHLVDAWEIWNEPNFDGYFHGADAGTYTRLLCAAYPAVKAYTDAPVLFGGIMYNDHEWLREAYDAGAQDCFDGLATHPYVGPSDAAPDTPAVGQIWRLTSTPAMREVMKEHGDRGKKIWITELGWSTGTDNEGNTWDRPVSREQQADFLARAVALIRADYPYVGPIIWYRDVDGPTDHYKDGFGLLNPDLSPKPSLKAFRQAVRGRNPSDAAAQDPSAEGAR